MMTLIQKMPKMSCGQCQTAARPIQILQYCITFRGNSWILPFDKRQRVLAWLSTPQGPWIDPIHRGQCFLLRPLKESALKITSISKEKREWKFSMWVVPSAKKAFIAMPTFSASTSLFTVPLATSISTQRRKKGSNHLIRVQHLLDSPGSTGKSSTYPFKKRKAPQGYEDFARITRSLRAPAGKVPWMRGPTGLLQILRMPCNWSATFWFCAPTRYCKGKLLDFLFFDLNTDSVIY